MGAAADKPISLGRGVGERGMGGGRGGGGEGAE